MAKWQGNRFVSGRSGVRSSLPAVFVREGCRQALSVDSRNNLIATPLLFVLFCFNNQDEMVKWLARVPYKLMGSRVAGSSPVASHFRLGQGKSKSCGFSSLPRRHNPDGFRGWRFRFGISTISFDVSFPLRDPRFFFFCNTFDFMTVYTLLRFICDLTQSAFFCFFFIIPHFHV